jgi:S-adenosylmethionine synthetase
MLSYQKSAAPSLPRPLVPLSVSDARAGVAPESASERTRMTSNDGAAREFQFTSESVTEGHPDKIADQISDAVLDAVLEQDPQGRVACETLITTGLIVVAGEISTSATLDIQKLARERIRAIGYTRAKFGFDADTCGVIVTLDEQSPDIAQGVDASFEAQHGNAAALDGVGAGDQGMMFGYAINETDALMPLPIMLAHRLARRLAEVRKDGTLDYLRPDGKTQVTVRYDIDELGHRTPVEIERVLISTQHRDGVDATTRIKPDLIEHVIDPILRGDHGHLLDDTRVAGRDFVYVNPTGSFVTGGPMGDTGLTGRKIVVDTYGGAAPHGGGAFSGKDPTKVDRSAAYAARYVAKNVVAAGLAHRCQVQVAYAIGVAHPVSINAECFGTAVIPEARIEELIRKHFDLRPAAIVRDLDLRRPIYTATAAYGHFGRHDLDLTWERTDRAAALRADAGLVPAAAGAR